MGDLTCVINGYCKGQLGGIYKIGIPQIFPNAQELRGRYFIGADFFKGTGSWSPLYIDYTDNQMYHFWFYVALSYSDGPAFAYFGNWTHGDTTDSPWVTAANHSGESRQDYLLSLMGIDLGNSISNEAVGLNKLGDWIYQKLSERVTGH